MPNAARQFLWGASVSAHAVEGEDFDSDWWRWEQRPARIAGGGTSEVAAGHLSRYRGDIQLAAKAGLHALQYSISWARIEPRPGVFDEAALSHYVSVFCAMEKAGITPIAVLQEFSLPGWFAGMGAWASREAPARFLSYVERVHAALGPYCRHWIPLLEPVFWQRMALGEGVWPRPGGSCWRPVPKVDVFADCHRAAWAYLTAQGPNEVGLSITAPALAPADPHSPWDMHAARWQQHRNEGVLPAMLDGRGGRDRAYSFLAVSTPGCQAVHFTPRRPRCLLGAYESAPGVSGSADSAAPDADAMAEALVRCSAWGAPMLVTGAGVATENDGERCRFLLDCADRVLSCRARGMDLMGFCYRSLLDGFEWRHGFTRRYGLVHVDRETLARMPNPSMFLYQDIARNDVIRAGAVARFCPDWQSRQKEAC